VADIYSGNLGKQILLLRWTGREMGKQILIQNMNNKR